MVKRMGIAAWVECPGPKEEWTSMMRRLLAMGLLAALVVSGLTYLAPRVAAEDTAINVFATPEPSQTALAPTDTFAPGDDIRVDLLSDGRGPDGIQDIFDVGLFRGGGRTQADLMVLAANVPLVNGRAVAILSGSRTKLLDDGQYQIDVCHQGYAVDFNCLGANRKLIGFSPIITIQLFTVSVTTEREAYIPGETMRAYWKALYIKNATAANGFSGNLYLYEGTTTRLYSTALSQAVGNVSFVIPTGALTTPAANHSASVIWTGSTNPGTHSSNMRRTVYVGDMSLSVWVSPFLVPAGQPFTTTVTTYVNWQGIRGPLPGVAVNLSYYLDPAPAPRIYYPELKWSLTTDAAGRTSLGQMATNRFVANNNYGVTANGTKILKVASGQASFGVTPPTYPMTLTLNLDGQRYLAGSTITATASAAASPGRPDPSSYLFTFTVLDLSGRVVSRAESVRTVRTMTFVLPAGFDGSVQVDVTVSNAAGDSATSTVFASVVAAELILNADPQVYQAGQTIRVSYATGLGNPNYLYTVTFGSYTVVQGNTTATSFTFGIPTSPAPSYDIFVQATGGGRTASNIITITLRSGFAIRTSWDKASYSPGDTAIVAYHIEAFGNSRLPTAYRVLICVASCSGSSVQSFLTSKTDDSFAYRVDAAAGSGDLNAAIIVYSIDGSFLGSNSQTVSVRAGSNPLWFFRLADVPLMNWILLALIVVLFLLFFFKGGYIKGLHMPHLRHGPKVPGAEKPKYHAPKEGLPPPGAGMATCSHCGSPIDVTTSKRPVEVMCPHCGETTTVGKETATGWEPPSRGGRTPP